MANGKVPIPCESKTGSICCVGCCYNVYLYVKNGCIVYVEQHVCKGKKFQNLFVFGISHGAQTTQW